MRPVTKVVFVAFFQGDALADRVKRICDGYVVVVVHVTAGNVDLGLIVDACITTW